MPGDDRGRRGRRKGSTMSIAAFSRWWSPQLAFKFDDPDVLPLAEAAKIVPGGGVSRGTVWRWATRGQRGVVLDSLRVGGRLFTTRRALQDFFDEVP